MAAAHATEQQLQRTAPNPYEKFCADPPATLQLEPLIGRAAALTEDAAPASPYAIFAAAEASASQPLSLPRPQSRRSSTSATAAGSPASPYGIFASGGASPQPWPQPRRRSDGEDAAARAPALRKRDVAPPTVSPAGHDKTSRGPRGVDPVLTALVHEEPPSAEVRTLAFCSDAGAASLRA